MLFDYTDTDDVNEPFSHPGWASCHKDLNKKTCTHKEIDNNTVHKQLQKYTTIGCSK